MAMNAAPPAEGFFSALVDDPYPLYARLRGWQPVFWNPTIQAWLLTRYADVMSVLSDRRFSARRLSNSPVSDAMSVEAHEPIVNSLLLTDPPDHTRLRNLVNKAFTPKVVERLRPRIHAVVDELLDAAERRGGGMDALADFAFPMPVTVIAELLGVPAADREALHRWAAATVGALDPIATAEAGERAGQARTELSAYLREIIAERRSQPQDDLISALVAVHEQGDVLDEAELVTMCRLILLAGHETTVNLVGNGLLALLQHPDQLRQFRERPEITVSAIEELLRYDAPVQLTGRRATEQIQLGDKTIEPEQRVVVLLGAANRDPAQFPNPDQLDLERSPNRHIAFGQGIHFCLGAPLARMEGQIALASLVRRFPNLHLAGEPVRRRTITLRGLESLPVAF